MYTSHTWSRILVIAGLISMVAGAIDPLEGCVVVLAGIAAAAIGAYLGQTHKRRFLYSGLAAVVCGVTAMIILSELGGIGGRSGHSLWWGLLMVPYPVGWLLGLIGAAYALVEFYRLRSISKQGLQ